MKKQRVLLLSDLHYCQEEYGGISRDEKAKRILRQIEEEHRKDPVSLILFLGDYSLDHWAWSTKGSWLTEKRSYAAEFAQYLKGLPAPYYLLPGNHEQYGNEEWRQLVGFDRTAEFTVGEYLFLLWDSFGENLNPTEHSDGTYTPPNVVELRQKMAAHPDKKVILCSHYFAPQFTPEEQELICDPRVVCLFQGHTHLSGVITLPKEYGGKKLIQTGGWAAVSPSSNYAWGVRELWLEEDGITSAYLVGEQQLYHKEVPYTLSARVQDTVKIALK
ncbi:MAG: metallophosphoesterase [Clostridia bacterium]|nr:metallophosphoesterase [Clostridia bacterium]